MTQAGEERKQKAVRTVKPISLLTESQLDLVHETSCCILEEVGVRVAHKRAVKTVTAAGCKREEDRILIPRKLVEAALAETAKTIHFAAPNSEKSFTVDAEKPVPRFGTGGQALYVLREGDSGFVRKAADGADLKEILSICDQIDEVDFITRPVEPAVDEESIDEEKSRIFAETVTKPMNLANLVKPEKLERIIEIVGNREYLSFIVCLAVSPLSVDDRAAEKFFTLVEHDIPVAISSCPQGGTTAPLSELGELAQLNAEILSGFVLANLIRPGAKVLYRGIPITSNLLKDGSPRWCTPDSIRRIAQAAELCRRYKIPCCGTAGVADESEPSAETVAQKTLSWVIEAAAGAQYINSAFGMLEQVMTVSPEQYVIDAMVLGKLRKKLETLGPETVRETAASGVMEALTLFGISITDEITREIASRIDFIFETRDDYAPEAAEKEIQAIRDTCVSGKGGNVFMKGARKGLRRGALYSGTSIKGILNLQTVRAELKKLRGTIQQGG